MLIWNKFIIGITINFKPSFRLELDRVTLSCVYHKNASYKARYENKSCNISREINLHQRAVLNSLLESIVRNFLLKVIKKSCNKDCSRNVSMLLVVKWTTFFLGTWIILSPKPRSRNSIYKYAPLWQISLLLLLIFI